MVKRSTIGSVLVAAALGLAAFVIIRNPSNVIPQSNFQQTFAAPLIADPLDFSAPLPFKTIAQQVAEFDFGIQAFPVGAAAVGRQSTGGGLGAISGGDINRAKSKFKQQFRGRTDVFFTTSGGVIQAFVNRATKTFQPSLQQV